MEVFHIQWFSAILHISLVNTSVCYRPTVPNPSSLHETYTTKTPQHEPTYRQIQFAGLHQTSADRRPSVLNMFRVSPTFL
jgi:hypothetical protein